MRTPRGKRFPSGSLLLQGCERVNRELQISRTSLQSLARSCLGSRRPCCSGRSRLRSQPSCRPGACRRILSTASRFGRSRCRLACSFVLSADVQDAVGVDVEGDFDLRDTTWRWWDAVEDETTDGLVLVGHRTLALQHVDLHGRLIIYCGGEHL